MMTIRSYLCSAATSAAPPSLQYTVEVHRVARASRYTVTQKTSGQRTIVIHRGADANDGLFHYELNVSDSCRR